MDVTIAVWFVGGKVRKRRDGGREEDKEGEEKEEEIKVRGEVLKETEGRIWIGYDQDILYTCMK